MKTTKRTLASLIFLAGVVGTSVPALATSITIERMQIDFKKQEVQIQGWSDAPLVVRSTASAYGSAPDYWKTEIVGTPSPTAGACRANHCVIDRKIDVSKLSRGRLGVELIVFGQSTALRDSQPSWSLCWPSREKSPSA